MFSDRILKCCDCSADFQFTVGEQEFFSLKGLTNEPKRCADCRLLSRMHRAGQGADNVSKVDCADCGKSTLVNFVPKGHSPVYCTYCLNKKKREEPEQGDKQEVAAERELTPSA